MKLLKHCIAKIRFKNIEEKLAEWRAKRGVCEVSDPGSRRYVTACAHYNNSGCPRDCRLYRESKVIKTTLD